MEYLMINESSLKVVCTEKDLEPYGICAEDLEYGDLDSRSFIEGVLEGALREVGFETKKHKVLIKLFPSADGGCEIFINRLCALSQKESAEDKEEKESEEDEKSNKSKDKKDKKKSESKKTLEKRLYHFDKLEHLLSVCSILSREHFCTGGEAFYFNSQGYFLCIECEDELSEYGLELLDEYSFILEYGEKKSANIHLPILKEYARSIASGNAIEILGKI